MDNRIRVLGFCASPRKANSYYLMERALEAAAAFDPERIETRHFHIAKKPMAPCDACEACRKLKKCHIDDAFQEAWDLWLDADVVLYSLPVYHMGVPAQLKAFVDRLGNAAGYYFGSSETRLFTIPRLLKAIGCIAQGVQIHAGQDLAVDYIATHALLMRCIPVAADMPVHIGVGGWTGGIHGKRRMEDLYEQDDAEAVATVEAVRQVAVRAVQMAMVVREGLKANRKILAGDPEYGYILDKIGS
jgi:multimeric flavodoxin WrbA